jgi:hypothetical protein
MFTFIGICWRQGLLDRGHRDYLWFRLVFLFAAGYLMVYYYFVLTAAA